jgi:hypothetical protein
MAGSWKAFRRGVPQTEPDPVGPALANLVIGAVLAPGPLAVWIMPWPRGGPDLETAMPFLVIGGLAVALALMALAAKPYRYGFALASSYAIAYRLPICMATALAVTESWPCLEFPLSALAYVAGGYTLFWAVRARAARRDPPIDPTYWPHILGMAGMPVCVAVLWAAFLR